MYRTKRCQPVPHRAKRTFFCLEPLPQIRHSGEEKVVSFQPDSRVTCEDSHGKLSTEAEEEEEQIDAEEHIDTDLSPVESKTKCQSRLSDTSAYSVRSTPLPVLQDRKPTEKLLLRRPGIYTAEPLKRNEALFEVLAKMSEFKLLQFNKTADSYKFYLQHFPLILQKQISDDQRTVTPTRRSTASPDSPMSAMVQRKTDLNKRLADLEEMVDDMENATEPDDVQFCTELRSSVFDPTSWPFTAVDHKGMLRRYTIDAVLRDLNK